MAQEKKYDLDEDVRESFHFTLKGYEYEFRQMTTEEIDEFSNTKDDKEIRKFLYSFITPVKTDSPTFEVLSKQMIAPHWKNFVHMIKVEMAGDGNS